MSSLSHSVAFTPPIYSITYITIIYNCSYYVMFQMSRPKNRNNTINGLSSQEKKSPKSAPGKTSSFFRCLVRSTVVKICIIIAIFWFPTTTYYFQRARIQANSAVINSVYDLLNERVNLAYDEHIATASTNNLTDATTVVTPEEVTNKLVETDLKTKLDSDKPQVVPVSSVNLRGSSGSTTNMTSANIAPSQLSPSLGDGQEEGSGFTRYDGVAIVTKVLWDQDTEKLMQWVCMINHAYNDRMKYDFVIFTTMPWKPSDVERLQKVAYPAKLTVALEGPPLEEQIAAMTKTEKDFLYKRCSVGNNATISWFHHCTEPGSRHVTNLGYSWQAEFRAYHIWTHAALKDYKYMIWIDSDAGIGKKWDVDPMKAMVENDLTILYAGWPYGKLRKNESVQRKMVNAYNTSICNVHKSQDASGISHIHASTCTDKPGTIFQIAGNHHITNLDVFRKDIHQKFLKDFTGDHRFSRMADDQLAVTIVGLMEQYLVNNRTDIPKKFTVWHERSHGMVLKIAHHNMYDVIKSERAPKRLKRLYKTVKGNYTGLEDRCGAVFKGEM